MWLQAPNMQQSPKAEQAAHDVAALEEGVPVWGVLHTQLLQLRMLVAAIVQALDLPPLQRSAGRLASAEMKEHARGSLISYFSFQPAGATHSWLADQCIAWSDINVCVCC